MREQTKQDAMRASTRWLLALGCALAIGGPARAQDAAAPPDGASAAPEPAAPRRRTKLKTVKKQETEAAPKLRGGEPADPNPRAPDRNSDEPIRGMAATKPARPSAIALSIVCDPGQAVFYEKNGGPAIWVTRSGSITIDNPLRPLTPDTTRVLQLVIGDKVATAYGGDLFALKRGASPAVLEGTLGGSIRWDASLPTMPDSLAIVADSGATLAELPFQSCGQAPATRAAPVANTRGGKTEQAASKKPAPSASSTRAKPPATAGAVPQGGAPARSVTMPQGAIAQ